MNYDVTALGELLIDFTETGFSAQGNPLLEANPGGAPCNVLAMLNRLGHKTTFIGKVGQDAFGDQLEEAVRESGTSTKGLVRDPQVHTTLAFVHTAPDGDRSFSFYRNPGADMMLSESDLKTELIENCRIFHFGSLSMTHENCSRATLKALEIAKNAGKLISFDPNLRESLWETLEEARKQILTGLSYAHILKISDNEITWLTGYDDYDRGAEWIRSHFPQIRLLLVSMGREGSRAYYENLKAEESAFIRPDTIETTGAGDTFCACILHFCLEQGIDSLNESSLHQMLRFANAAASIVTTRKGALRVMPSAEEVEAALRE